MGLSEDFKEADFLSAAVAVRSLYIALTTLRTAVKMGRLPSRIVFGRIYIKKTDLEAYRAHTAHGREAEGQAPEDRVVRPGCGCAIIGYG